MAKRKTRRAKAKQKKSFLSGIPSEIKTLAYGLLYSAVIKEPTEKMTKSITDNFGLNLTDNAVRIAGNVLGRRVAGRFIPQARQVFNIGLGIEGAEAGKMGFNFLTNMFNKTTSTPDASVSTQSQETLNFYS